MPTAKEDRVPCDECQLEPGTVELKLPMTTAYFCAKHAKLVALRLIRDAAAQVVGQQAADAEYRALLRKYGLNIASEAEELVAIEELEEERPQKKAKRKKKYDSRGTQRGLD